MELKHKYIKLWNEMSLNFWDGFLIHEDKVAIYCATPVCYEWLQKINKEEWLNEMILTPFQHDFYSPHEMPYYRPFFTDDYLWVLDFEITESDKEHFHLIGNFFEHFKGCRVESSEDLKNALIHTISKLKKILSETVLIRILHFIINYYEKNNPSYVQRLDLLFFKNLLNK